MISHVALFGGLKALPADARMPENKRKRIEESSLGLYRALRILHKKLCQ